MRPAVFPDSRPFPLLAACFFLAAGFAFAQGTPELTIKPVRVMEPDTGTRGAVLNVYLSAAAGATVTVNWSTSDGSAIAGQDYTAGSGTLTFNPGEVQKQITVSITGDTAAELDEDCIVGLSGASGADVTASSARVLIRDNEVPSLVMQPASVVLPETVPPGATGAVNLTVLNADRNVSLGVAVESGTAQVGVDLLATAPSVPLAVSTPLPIRGINDSLTEGDESFLLDLTRKPGVETIGLHLRELRTQDTPYAGGISMDGDLAAKSGVWLTVYRKAAGGWTREAEVPLPADIVDPFAYYRAVAADDGVIAISQPGEGVWIYQKVGAAWQMTRRLTAPVGANGFGAAVAMSDQVLAVGDSTQLMRAGQGGLGRVRIYERHLGGRDQWGLRQTLTPSGAASSFGAVMAMWGDHLAVAAPDSDFVNVYHRNSTTAQWSEAAAFFPQQSFYRFGMGLDIEGDALVIGAPDLVSVPEIGGPPGRGLIHASFNTAPGGATWSTLASIPHTRASSRFGEAVAIDRSQLVVGDSERDRKGGALVFYRLGNSWTPRSEIDTPPGYFGLYGLGGVAAMHDGWLFLNEAHLNTDSVAPMPLHLYRTGLVPGTIVDDESVTVTAEGGSVVEPAAAIGFVQLVFTLQLSRPLPVPVSVLYSLRDGTATGGADYQWASEWVQIPAGSTVANVNVSILPDALFEPSETFLLVLEQSTFGKTGPPATGTITPGAAPQVVLSTASVVEGNGGPQQRTLTLELTAGAMDGSSVDWTLENSTASAPEDFVAGSGTVTLTTGQTSGTFTVTLNGDDVCEPAESFLVRLSNPSNLTIGGGNPFPVTISDDDTGVPVPDSYSVDQGATLGGINVRDNDCSVLPVVAASQPQHGILTFNTSGAFTYTPTPNFIGTDTFTYQGGGGTLAPGTALIAPNATFRYLNPLDGIDPADTNPQFNTVWPTSGFDDSQWQTGSGLMGYGDIITSSGSLAPETFIGLPLSGSRRSAYFRHRFNVSSPGTYNLELSIGRDDAAIVYVNGQEVVRSHEPGVINLRTAPDTWRLEVENVQGAWTNAGNEGDPNLHQLAAVPLTAGLNTLAVSVHNAGANSSDLALKLYHLNVVSAVSPGAGTGSPIAVTIQVRDGHLPPVLSADAYSTSEDVPLNPVTALYSNDGLLNAAGAAYDPILEAEAINEQHGTVTGLNAAIGSFTFTPEHNYSGPASFQYRVRDKDGWSLPATVTIDIAGDLTVSAFTRTAPAASLLSSCFVSAPNLPAGEVADALLPLRAGQTISIRATSSPGVINRMALLAPDGSAVPAGESLTGQLQNVPVPVTGNYTLLVHAGTGGPVSITVLINGGLPASTLPATAPYRLESVPALISGPKGVPRSAVYNQMPLSGATDHYYSLQGSGGEQVAVFLHAMNGSSGTFRVEDFGGSVLAQSAVSTRSSGGAERSLTLPADGEYRVVVNAKTALQYTLQVYRDGAAHDAMPEPSVLRRSAAGSLSGLGSGEQMITFANFGDYGSDSSNEAAVARMVKTWQPDFIIANGDHNYSNDFGVGSPSWTARVGDYYGEFILGRLDNRYPEQSSTVQRYFPVPGNHDSGPDLGNGGELSGYFDYFLTNPGGLPRLPDGVHLPQLSYYKFRQGNCEFYLIDSDNASVSGAANTEQRTWLKQQLAASTARWKFLAMHHPPYSSGSVHGSAPLLQWGADWQGLTAIFAGHDHIYERLDIGFGITQFISGLGGRSIYGIGAVQPQSQFRYVGDYGSMRVRAGADGVLFEFLATNDGASGANGGTLIDSFSIGTPPVPGVSSGMDEWNLEVRPHQTITLSTDTPLPPGTLTNLIQPKLEVRDAGGSLVASNTGGAADGFNARLTVAVPADVSAEGSIWNVRVVNQNAQSGEYLLLKGVSSPRDFYDGWTLESMPSAAVADRDPGADPDKDGWSNLVEYATGRDPSSAEPAPLLDISTGPKIRLALPSNLPHGVSCTVERTADLAAGAWSAVSRRTGSDAWQSPDGLLPQPDGVAGWTLSFQFPAMSAFYRLRFSLEP